jgi:hypothetical protein
MNSMIEILSVKLSRLVKTKSTNSSTSTMAIQKQYFICF